MMRRLEYKIIQLSHKHASKNNMQNTNSKQNQKNRERLGERKWETYF